MDPLSFIHARTADGPVLINLRNVTSIVVDLNGSFGVQRRVTVNFVGGAPMDFDEEYGDELLNSLSEAGLYSPAPSNP